MANRRMFSLKVIDTDFFMDMPTSSQLLYFHLALRADDDGFVSSPKKIIKASGSNDDDFRILVSKQFVIPFENGVCVIKHWHIHNLIRGDRRTETEYKEERLSLQLIDNKYQLNDGSQLATKCQPIDNQMSAQVSIGKVRLGEDNIKTLSGTPDDTPKKYIKTFKDIPQKKTPEYFEFINNPIDPDNKAALNYAAMDILNHLNEMCDRNFRAVDINLDLIKARLKSGVSMITCFKIINMKCEEWGGNPDYEDYLRPSTLFNRTKFEQYYGLLLKKDREGKV